jgi:hypothetical protein
MATKQQRRNRKRRWHGIERQERERDMTVLVECSKKTYLNKQAAKLALLNVRSVRREQIASGKLVGKGGEQTVYRCPKCGLWHLTSQAKDLRPDLPGRGWNGKW